MDMITLLLTLVLVNLCMCGALLIGGARVRATLAGLLDHPWSLLLLARAGQCAGWAGLLIALVRPQTLAWAAQPAKLLLCAGLALETAALMREQVGGWLRRALPLLAAALALAGALAGDGSAGAWPLLAVLGLLFAAGGIVLFRSAPQLPVRRACGVALALPALLMLLLELLRARTAGLDGGDAPSGALLLVLALTLIGGLAHLLLAREQEQQEVIRMAVIDPLTEAPNRRGFFNALAPWMALARRPGHATAIVFLDLDHFKRVNDTYGHVVGDLVLKSVVEIVRKQLRDSDLIGRFGGAELAILLPRTSLEEAQIVAERVRKAIDSMPIKTDRAMLSVTASLGLTTIAAHDSFVTLFKRVDQALAAAKQAGRNQVSVCTATAPDAVV